MSHWIPTQIILSSLPQEMAEYIRNNILHPQSSFQTYSREAVTQAQRGYEALYPQLEPLLDRLFAATDGYTGLIVSAGIVIAGIMLLNMVMRAVLWWTRFVTRIAFWAAVVVVLAMAWERGPLQSARDVVVVVSKVAGYAAAVKDIWMDEYQRYDAQRVRASSHGGGSHR